MRTEQPTKCFVPLQKLRVRFKPSSISLLTVPRRYFCCGSLLSVFGAGVSVTFHLMCVYIIFSSVWLLSGHLLGNSCSLGRPYVLFVF